MEINKKDLFSKANDAAKNAGYENIKDAGEKIKAGLNSKNPLEYKRAVEAGRAVLDNLLLLTLQQVIEPDFYAGNSVYRLAREFDDGWLDEGNSRLYVKTLETGNTTYDAVADNFVPDHRTNPTQELHQVQMYSAPNVLAPDSFQYYKGLTLQEAEWIPYFKAGNLAKYVAKITEQISSSYEKWKFDNMVNYVLTKSANFKTQITGTGEDMYDSMNEFLAQVAQMKELNNAYMIGDTQAIKATDPRDLIILMSPKNKQLLQSGIKSQLFNSHLLDLDSILSSDNIVTLGNKLVIGTEAQVISISPTQKYIDDNTIIVFEKRAFRWLYQLRENGSQSYPLNLTNQISFHSWGTKTMLPWYQGFVYKNPNLSKLPSSKEVIGN